GDEDPLRAGAGAAAHGGLQVDGDRGGPGVRPVRVTLVGDLHRAVGRLGPGHLDSGERAVRRHGVQCRLGGAAGPDEVEGEAVPGGPVLLDVDKLGGCGADDVQAGGGRGRADADGGQVAYRPAVDVLHDAVQEPGRDHLKHGEPGRVDDRGRALDAPCHGPRRAADVGDGDDLG